eukprot:scaffold106983_cov35-Tisochrysis_lutea.AAC.2
MAFRGGAAAESSHSAHLTELLAQSFGPSKHPSNLLVAQLGPSCERHLVDDPRARPWHLTLGKPSWHPQH